jgi:hypothetical protein
MLSLLVQCYLRSPEHQNAEQGLLAAASHQAMLEAVTEKTWLMQVNDVLSVFMCVCSDSEENCRH